MWPLSISELFMLGRRTVPKLQKHANKKNRRFSKNKQINTNKKIWKTWIANVGICNGIDNSEVKYLAEKPKGIGNSTTLPQNITELEKLEEILLALTEQVTYRLRKYKMKAKSSKCSITYQ